jgi:hypothetical protein
MAGEKKTTPEDLSILVASLWREPKDRPKVARVVGKHADPVGAQATEILDAARETAAKVAALVSGDRKTYIAQAAQALEQFGQEQNKLGQLSKGAGRHLGNSKALFSNWPKCQLKIADPDEARTRACTRSTAGEDHVRQSCRGADARVPPASGGSNSARRGGHLAPAPHRAKWARRLLSAAGVGCLVRRAGWAGCPAPFSREGSRAEGSPGARRI